MRVLLIFAIIGLSICEEAQKSKSKWGDNVKDGVLELTDDTYDAFVEKHKFVFIKFYAPWCGHCKALAPEYLKLVEKMDKEENGIPVVAVDATVQKKLADKFKIEGFPTLKLIIDKKPIDYNGQRKLEDMYSFIVKKTGDPLKKLASKADFDKLEKENLSLIVVAKAEDAKQEEAARQAAYGFEDVQVHYFVSAEICKSKYCLVLNRNFDDGKKVLEKEEIITQEEITKFVEQNKYPLVMEFDQAAAERIFGGEMAFITLFTDKEEETENYLNFKLVAGKMGKDLVFTRSKISKDLGEKLAEFLGVTEKKDQLRIVKFAGGELKKYALPDEKFTPEKIQQFIEDYKANKLEAYYKSEEPPKENNEAIKVVVGKTFKQMVTESGKNVMLFIYAPWCGHCKKFKPTYEKLAKALLKNEDLVLTKMDGTANEVDGIQIQGFPTLKFYKKGSTEAIDYSGDRSFDDMVKFFEKNVGHKLEVEEEKKEDKKDDKKEEKEKDADL